MLQSIRDHTQGWLAGIIVSVLILMFALWGISAYFTGGKVSTVVAQVNGAEITKERFTLAYEQARRQLQAQQGLNTPLEGKQEAGLKDRVLHDLIVTEVLKQASLTQHYYISSTQLNNYLEQLPEFQVKGHFSMARFQEVMATSLYSANELLDLIRTTLLIAQPKLGIILTSVGLPNEVNHAIALVNQERNLRYLTLTPASLGKVQKPQISPDKIVAYYKKHEAEFKTPEKVSISYLDLTLSAVMNRVHPTVEMLKNYYNDNINNYTQPAQWKIKAILVPVPSEAVPSEVAITENKAKAVLEQIHQGASFDKFARQYSDASLQAKLQTWVSLSQLDSVYQKPVIALTTSNPVSELIRMKRGFVILKMIAKQDAQVRPFNQVKDKVKEMVVRQQAEEKMASLRDQLSDLTYEHPESLVPAAKALGLPVKTTEFFTRKKGGQDVSSYKKVRDTAFSHEVMSLRNNSDVIQLDPEESIVLRVKSYMPPTLLPLQSVSKQIEGRLQVEKTKEQLSRWADDIDHQLQGGVSEDQIAQKYHLNWTSVGFIGRYANKVPSAILDKAFSLRRPQSSKGKNSYGVVQLPNGYAVIALQAVRDGVVKDKKQYALFTEQVQNSEGFLEYELYKQSLMKQAKVSIKNRVVA